jgi:hypothetical protein
MYFMDFAKIVNIHAILKIIVKISPFLHSFYLLNLYFGLLAQTHLTPQPPLIIGKYYIFILKLQKSFQISDTVFSATRIHMNEIK